MTPVPSALLRTRALLALVLVVIVFVAMMLTSQAMSDLREAIPQLSNAMSWLEGMNLPFDMDHVAFFAGVTFGARLLLPGVRWWWIALVVVVLAGGTELIQFWVPGRTPRLQDARDDLIGGAIGLLLGALLLGLTRVVRDALITQTTPHQQIMRPRDEEKP